MNQFRTLQLEDTIKFLGYRKDSHSYYILAADVFTISSSYEAFPYVILEALILNKSFVSKDTTGARELLKDGEPGLLVENLEEYPYKGLNKIITDQALRAFYPKKIFQRVRSKMHHSTSRKNHISSVNEKKYIVQNSFLGWWWW